MRPLAGYFCGTIEGNIQFTEIEEQRTHLLSLLEDFEEKLDRSAEIVRNFITEMRVHLAKIRTALNTVRNAKAAEDMADVDVPNLEW